MPKYTRARIEEIRGHLADFASCDGVSVAAFAEDIGVSAWTFYTWRRRFGDESEIDSGRDQASLLEIQGPLAMRQPIEVVIGSATVRVPQGVDVRDLSAVLQAVRSC